MLYYFDKLPEHKIMMGSSIFSIIASELQMKEKAWDYFEDLFDHFHEDQYYIASESVTNDCWPFITGLGGFMAVFYYGFAGIRVRNNGLLISPCLNPQITQIKFNKIYYQGKILSLEIKNEGKEFVIENQGGDDIFTLFFRKNNPYKCRNHPIPKKEIGNEIQAEFALKNGEFIIFFKDNNERNE